MKRKGRRHWNVMQQSRKDSLIESVVNILVGYIISFIANLLVLPCFGFYPSINDSFHITNVFTLISLVRSYLLRRLFTNRGAVGSLS